VSEREPCPGCGKVAGAHWPGCPVLAAALADERREGLPSWLVERDDDDGLTMLGRGLDDE
jgi:hypothetical protein